MTNLIVIAVTLGFFGSVHCVSMCGSLMVYHFSNVKHSSFALKFAVYHIFRVLAYALLGMMFGQIGFIGSLIGIQKFISLVSGVILIYVALSYFFPVGIKFLSHVNLYSWVNELFGFSSASYYRFALSGFANGLLPCGFSFIAITFSVTTYSMLYGLLFMIFFGLSTIPALFAVSVLSNKINFRSRVFQFAMPGLAFLTGVLLILRTMNVGIPYISPEYQISDKQVLMQCHK
ncbi:MAG: membrane protein [Bacteroidia bacterium]|nr:MAG: membrane protein [Bacteroidia bacterium]